MKTKLLLTTVLLLCMNSCTENRKKSQTYTEPELMPISEFSLPYMLAISTKLESDFVHPDMYFDWLLEHKPVSLLIGHVGLVKYQGESFAVTAPHVRTHLKKFHSFPASDLIEKWTLAPRGQEVCFAKLPQSLHALL